MPSIWKSLSCVSNRNEDEKEKKKGGEGQAAVDTFKTESSSLRRIFKKKMIKCQMFMYSVPDEEVKDSLYSRRLQLKVRDVAVLKDCCLKDELYLLIFHGNYVNGLAKVLEIDTYRPSGSINHYSSPQDICYLDWLGASPVLLKEVLSVTDFKAGNHMTAVPRNLVKKVKNRYLSLCRPNETQAMNRIKGVTNRNSDKNLGSEPFSNGTFKHLPSHFDLGSPSQKTRISDKSEISRGSFDSARKYGSTHTQSSTGHSSSYGVGYVHVSSKSSHVAEIHGQRRSSGHSTNLSNSIKPAVPFDKPGDRLSASDFRSTPNYTPEHCRMFVVNTVYANREMSCIRCLLSSTMEEQFSNLHSIRNYLFITDYSSRRIVNAAEIVSCEFEKERQMLQFKRRAWIKYNVLADTNIDWSPDALKNFTVVAFSLTDAPCLHRITDNRTIEYIHNSMSNINRRNHENTLNGIDHLHGKNEVSNEYRFSGEQLFSKSMSLGQYDADQRKPIHAQSRICPETEHNITNLGDRRLAGKSQSVSTSRPSGMEVYDNFNPNTEKKYQSLNPRSSFDRIESYEATENQSVFSKPRNKIDNRVWSMTECPTTTTNNGYKRNALDDSNTIPEIHTVLQERESTRKCIREEELAKVHKVPQTSKGTNYAQSDTPKGRYLLIETVEVPNALKKKQESLNAKLAKKEEQTKEMDAAYSQTRGEKNHFESRKNLTGDDKNVGQLRDSTLDTFGFGESDKPTKEPNFETKATQESKIYETKRISSVCSENEIEDNQVYKVGQESVIQSRIKQRDDIAGTKHRDDHAIIDQVEQILIKPTASFTDSHGRSDRDKQTKPNDFISNHNQETLRMDLGKQNLNKGIDRIFEENRPAKTAANNSDFNLAPCQKYSTVAKDDEFNRMRGTESNFNIRSDSLSSSSSRSNKNRNQTNKISDEVSQEQIEPKRSKIENDSKSRKKSEEENETVVLVSSVDQQRSKLLLPPRNEKNAGLHNIGNTCYMNSVLQCLSIVQWENLEVQQESENFVKDFCQLMNDMTRGKRDNIKPGDFKKSIISCNTRFSSSDQQDAHEFLTFVLYTLKQQMTGTARRFLLDKFCGELLNITEIHCPENHIIEAGQDMHTVSLSVKMPGTPTVKRSLASFVEKEELDEEDKAKCKKCRGYFPCSLSLAFGKLPEILVLHLKKFDFFSREKLDIDVKFPFLGLEVKDSKGICREYDLHAVCNHSGSLTFGHYTAFVKSQTDRNSHEWYKYDDSWVEKVSPEEIKRHSRKAYLLFYKLSNSGV